MTAVAAVAGDNRALAAFTGIHLVGLGAYGVAVASDVAVLYTGLIVTLAVVVCRLHLRFDLGPGVLWGLAVWGAGHMAGGMVRRYGDGE